MSTSTISSERAGFASLADVAAYLGTSQDTIRRRISDGTLPAYKMPKTGTIRVAWADVSKLLEPIPAVSFNG